MRVALADPAKLYAECQGGNHGTDYYDIASGIPGVTTKCSWLSEQNERDSTAMSFSVATLQAGSSVPLGSVPEAPPISWYTASGNPIVTAWIADASATYAPGKIWAPNLPAHALSHPSATGYPMPSGFPACTVFFPGTYTTPITITGSTPVFFTSGIYYFEDSVTISGNAKVVVGDGGIEGCTTDQEAAFNAVNAPTSHNITGVGATFVFGKIGRLVINDSTAGTGVSVRFNNRYVGATDVSTVTSAGVSIMTVNGVTGVPTDSAPIVELNLPHLYVPASLVGVATTTPPARLRPPPHRTSTRRPSSAVPTR